MGQSGKKDAAGDERRDEEGMEASGGATKSKRPASRTGYESGRQREEQYPTPPLPEQHQESPGLESEVTPRPKFESPRYRAAGKLEGRAALVTGGDSGIGRAVAVLYAKEGADVAIVYLPEEQSDAEETRRHVQAEGRRCVLIPGDVTDAAFCRSAVERTVSELGKLDILVNNAAYPHNVDSLHEG